jgi:hypothetical protein
MEAPNAKPKTPFKAENTKDEFIYTRIDEALLAKIDRLKEAKKLKNRSQAIRSILNWAFDNGVETT